MADMLIQVGAGAGGVSLPTTTKIPPRAGNLGDLIVSQLHGRYYEQTVRGNTFFVASQAVATSTVGLATTYTGLCLSNPVGSTVNLVLTKASIMQSVIQAVQVEAYALATGYNATTNVTHTTPATPQTTLIGSGLTAIAKADTAATLPTAPVYAVFVQNTATATANGPGSVIDLEGSIILKPGAYIAWVTPAQASVAGMWYSFMWEEVPILA